LLEASLPLVTNRLKKTPGKLPPEDQRGRQLARESVRRQQHEPGGARFLEFGRERCRHGVADLRNALRRPFDAKLPAGCDDNPYAHGIAWTSIRSCPWADHCVLATSTSLLPECRMFCRRHQSTTNFRRSCTGALTLSLCKGVTPQ